MENNTHTTTDLEQVLTIKDEQQVISEEQRTTTVEDSHLDTPIDNIHTMDDYVMNIEEVTARNILETPVIITTVNWTTAQTVGQRLYGFNIPDIFTTLKNFHDTMLTTYSAFKPTIKIHFKLNSTPFHQGKVLCWYNPLNQLGPFPVEKSISLTSISMMPSVFLDASLANSGEILIPFEFYKTYFNTNSDSGLPPMGSINISVFNPLISAPGSSTTATIQVLLSCTELQLHLPIAPHTVLFSSGTISETIPTIQTEAQVLETIKEGFGKVKDGFMGAKNAVGTAYGNFKTGNFSGGFDAVGKGFSSVGSIFKVFNLDKPAIIDATTKNCIYPVSPLAHMRGVDTSVRLGAAPEAGYLTHELFSTTSGSEHLIKELIQMKGFHDTTSWDTSQVPGTVLGVVPVAPWYSPTGPSLTVGTDTYFSLENTYLSYLAAFYNFWRGSMSFRWDVVSSKMHSGRLGFIFFPNDDPACKYGASPASLDLSLYTNNPIYYFDLAESKTAELTIPFQSGTHMKWMLPAQTRVNSRPLPAQLENYMTGTLAIVVINQLMAPSNVSQSVTFNSFVGAGPDMEFEAPATGDYGYFYEDLGYTPPLLQTEAQGQEDPQPTRSSDTHPKNFLFKSGSEVRRLDAYNEHIDDVRDLTRRYTIKDTITLKMNLNTTTGFYDGAISILNSPTSLTETAAFTNHLRYQSFLARISEMYAFWHGSIRYKILPYTTRISNLQLTASYNYAPQWINTPSGPGTFYSFLENTGDPVSWTNVSQQSALEVELPYYSVYTQLATSLINTPYTGSPVNLAPQCYATGWLTLNARTSDTNSMRKVGDDYFLDLHVLSAGGDDLAFSLPVAPPQTWYL
jgi:hypothetical protein